jgi:acyl carrier protein
LKLRIWAVAKNSKNITIMRLLMTENIEQKIIKTVAETLRVEEGTISSQSKFVDDLGADSLDLVELMMAIEAAFDCDIPDEEASKIATVADAVSYVEKNLKS